jgi:hypothetical protein
MGYWHNNDAKARAAISDVTSELREFVDLSHAVKSLESKVKK